MRQASTFEFAMIRSLNESRETCTFNSVNIDLNVETGTALVFLQTDGWQIIIGTYLKWELLPNEVTGGYFTVRTYGNPLNIWKWFWKKSLKRHCQLSLIFWTARHLNRRASQHSVSLENRPFFVDNQCGLFQLTAASRDAHGNFRAARPAQHWRLLTRRALPFGSSHLDSSLKILTDQIDMTTPASLCPLDFVC